MGRGRQKAKQTKVARELKYFSPDTDLNALQRELGGAGSGTHYTEPSPPSDEGEDDEDDPYAAWSRTSG
jgi:hypothetical protein